MTANDTPHWIEVEFGDFQRNSPGRLPDGIYVPKAALDDLRAENERLWRNEAVLIEESKGLHNERDVAVRERDEARAERDDLRFMADVATQYLDEALVKLKAAEAERDRLRADLALIAETDPIDAVLDPDLALRVARAALAVPAPPTDEDKRTPR